MKFAEKTTRLKYRRRETKKLKLTFAIFNFEFIFKSITFFFFFPKLNFFSKYSNLAYRILFKRSNVSSRDINTVKPYRLLLSLPLVIGRNWQFRKTLRRILKIGISRKNQRKLCSRSGAAKPFPRCTRKKIF